MNQKLQDKYNAGITAGRVGYYTQAQFDTAKTSSYNSGVTAGTQTHGCTYIGCASMGYSSLPNSANFNATGISNYKSFSANNFLLNVTSVNCPTGDDGYHTNAVSKSYNASNGILTVYYPSNDITLNFDVYCYW